MVEWVTPWRGFPPAFSRIDWGAVATVTSVGAKDTIVTASFVLQETGV